MWVKKVFFFPRPLLIIFHFLARKSRYFFNGRIKMNVDLFNIIYLINQIIVGYGFNL